MPNIETGEIEKGDTLNDITNEINEKYDVGLTTDKIAEVNGIADANKIYTGNYIKLPKQDMELRFDNEYLQAYDKNYGIAFEDLKWKGVSGKLGKYEAIPEGVWQADPANVEYWNNLPIANKIGSTVSGVTQNIPIIGQKIGAWPGGTYAWGGARTELANVASGQQNTGYYIHGGGSPGSAGCIDLTGSNNSFHNWLTNTWQKTIDIIVDYK